MFLSHSVRDARYATALTKALSRRGLKVWSFGTSVRAGDSWLRQVDNALRSVDLCVVLLSDESVNSRSVNFEMGAMIGRGKKVVPVYLSPGARRRAPAPIEAFQGVLAEHLTPVVAAEKVARAIERAAA